MLLNGLHCLICVRLDHFLDIRKGLWRSENEWPQSSLFQPRHKILKL
ncbi:hypothetical protein E2C01_048206 [Portunus trituberculatus]|uniref:Uncharacterized protein n=1 Tax=Portunus trituberculatus TaxID=210409 RepID=A0A5B7G9Z0_PORTR|nr:hypothetical protein [Portunus trituberculatus]